MIKNYTSRHKLAQQTVTRRESKQGWYHASYYSNNTWQKKEDVQVSQCLDLHLIWWMMKTPEGLGRAIVQLLSRADTLQEGVYELDMWRNMQAERVFVSISEASSTVNPLWHEAARWASNTKPRHTEEDAPHLPHQTHCCVLLCSSVAVRQAATSIHYQCVNI